MAIAMDADLAAMMDGIIVDPVDGPVRTSLITCGILTPGDLLEANDAIVDFLTYDDNGTDKEQGRPSVQKATNQKSTRLS